MVFEEIDGYVLKSLPLEEIQRLFEFLPNTQFWIKDKKGKFLVVNHALLAHFGLEKSEQLVGKTDADISPLHLASEYLKDDQAIMISGNSISNKLELIWEKDESLSWYSTSKIPLRDERGFIWGTAGFTRRMKSVEMSETLGAGIHEVATFLQKNYSKKITVEMMAKLAKVSVVQFHRNFLKAFRISPLRYLNNLRHKGACQLLLHTDLSMMEVARQSGYTDQSYFTKQFYKHLRILPKEYRKKYRGKMIL